jgi:CBS-domain-containing membrane protein
VAKSSIVRRAIAVANSIATVMMSNRRMLRPPGRTVKSACVVEPAVGS